MEDIVTIENVTIQYPDTERPALLDINLRVKKGEFLVITGPTTSGKTTMCLALNGLIPQTVRAKMQGKITVAGMDTQNTPVSALSRNVGLVLADPEIQFVAGDVKHDVVFALENIGTPREEILKRLEWAIRITRLKGLENRWSFTLSGGQKQRVGIAAGLALGPKVLVLDEPTTQLDPIGKYEVFSTVKRLNKEQNMTIIMAEHETAILAPIADRIVVLKEGRIISIGGPEEVLTNVDLMHEVGVRVPQVTELGTLLKRGNMTTTVPLTIQETYDIICKLLPRGVKRETKRVAEEPKGPPIIEVRSLWFIYPEPPTIALRNVNLDIYPGESVGIIGQNGSGKTTLVKHFNGINKPTKGKILVNGLDTRYTMVGKLSKTVGHIYQNPDHQIFCNTVREEMSYGPKNLGLPEEEINRRVDKVLKSLRMTDISEFNPIFLSKGERGFVALASVLVMEPDIIIVDEPTTGQDWASAMAIMKECQKLNMEGKTVITISHNMRLIAETTKRVIVMKQGRILLDGPTKDVFSQPDILKETFIESPQIPILSQMLEEYGFPPDVLTVDEMYDFIVSKLSK